MDRPANLTNGTNATSSIPGSICRDNSSSLDRILIIAPSWVTVNQDLRWVFPLHTYGFACLFFVLSFYTLFSILNLRSLISSRPFMTSINVFLCLLGVSRSGCLFIDPYNLQETMPKVIGSIMWDIGFPCVTSAFCLLQLAFLQLTQLKFPPEKLQKESCLSLIITSHFSCIIASDVALAFHNHFITKYVVQLVFLVWSTILYLIFLYAGFRVMALLKTQPNSVLTRESSLNNQKATVAPYNNLASSVAAALVPTLLSQKFKASEDNEPAISQSGNGARQKEGIVSNAPESIIKPVVEQNQTMSTVPEVYVRPPTPTVSTMDLPIITVSCPSRRSSLASSRRDSDTSRGSRRDSDCSVKFINEDGTSSTTSNKPLPVSDRPRTPEGILRRHSEMTTPSGSIKDLRRCSDFSHEKNRSSQFATKLRRNSDFGNRTPKRMMPAEDQPKLPRVLDVSPSGSRRNSDFGGLAAAKAAPESRRNSDVSYRHSSDLAQMSPLVMNRRSSDVSIKTLSKSPPHFPATPKIEVAERSESDSEQADFNEKAALMMNDKPADEEPKVRRKSLTWKNVDRVKIDDDITAESGLLADNLLAESKAPDFTLHAILNHIAHVNRSKSNTTLHISEMSTGTARKSQIRRVLNIIYATAILGIILCIVDLIRICGPYGLLGETVKFGKHTGPVEFPKPWPWLVYQTLCRGLELLMGCTMASITKEPSVSPRHQYFNNYSRSYTERLKQRDNPYI